MKLILTERAHLKLKYFVDLCDVEISGIGKSVMNKDGDLVFQDLLIVKQECSGGHTELDEESLAKCYLELRKNGEKVKDWNVWWHSHADMGVFWSATDEDTIANHAGLQSYIVSIVANKKGQYNARLDIFLKHDTQFKDAIKNNLYETINLDVAFESSKKFQKEIKRLETIIEKAYKELDKVTELSSRNISIKKYCQDEIDDKLTKQTIQIYPRYQQRYNEYGYQNKLPIIKPKKWSWEEDEKDLTDKFQDELNKQCEDPFFYEENPNILR